MSFTPAISWNTWALRYSLWLTLIVLELARLWNRRVNTYFQSKYSFTTCNKKNASCIKILIILHPIFDVLIMNVATIKACFVKQDKKTHPLELWCWRPGPFSDPSHRNTGDRRSDIQRGHLHHWICVSNRWEKPALMLWTWDKHMNTVDMWELLRSKNRNVALRTNPYHVLYKQGCCLLLISWRWTQSEPKERRRFTLQPL